MTLEILEKFGKRTRCRENEIFRPKRTQIVAVYNLKARKKAVEEERDRQDRFQGKATGQVEPQEGNTQEKIGTEVIALQARARLMKKARTEIVNQARRPNIRFRDLIQPS